MRPVIFYTTITILFLLIITVIGKMWDTNPAKEQAIVNECYSKGGVLIQTTRGIQCLDRKALIQIEGLRND